VSDDDRLAVVLTEIRRRGGIGTQSVADAIAHSDRFVRACPGDVAVGADLGSGGGLPALVLAVRRTDLELHLVERRATRADLLHFGVSALELSDRVHVHAEDLAAFRARRVPVDLVTARSFAALDVTLTAAASLLGGTGWVLVSAPPAGSSATQAVVDASGLRDLGEHDGVLRFERSG
jgi:16S rRNA G527 N7-methylase RsmG